VCACPNIRTFGRQENHCQGGSRQGENVIFGLGGEEIFFIILITIFVVGPERLPGYVQQITEFIKGARRFMADAKAKVDEELGPEFSDVDWQKLDPRQYDPRKIVREALPEDTILDPQRNAAAVGVVGVSTTGAATAAPRPRTPGFDTYTALAQGSPAPFDPEAT
jgi:sec-independent protein translocase protein TatB